MSVRRVYEDEPYLGRQIRVMLTTKPGLIGIQRSYRGCRDAARVRAESERPEFQPRHDAKIH